MSVRLWCRRACTSVLLVLLFVGLYAPSLAAQQEPSPISIQLAVPGEAGPGSVIEVSIQYDAVDLNAGADLNYNVFGPAHVLRRSPEPPNPIANTWYPGAPGGIPAKGTIVVELQVHAGSIGQAIEHQVEVRWGNKVRNFRASTAVQAIAPTPAPTSRPRPQPTRPAATPAPAPTPTPAARSEVELESVTLVDGEGRPLTGATANQPVILQASYTSSAELQDVQVEVQFEPAVVELAGLEQENGVYRIEKPVLAAGQDADLLGALLGQVRSYAEGGAAYELRAIVRIVAAEGSVEGQPAELASEPVVVSQSMDLAVQVSVDAAEVRAGENVIVHVSVENQGSMPASQVRIKLAGLPEGFVAAPDALEIAVVAADGGREQRVITVRTAAGYNGPVVVRVVASVGDETVLAEPVSVECKAPVPLRLQAESSASTAYAGEAVYVRVTAENVGAFPARDVTARLIDVNGTMGVLVQDVGEIGAGQADEWVFVVDILKSFPVDTEAAFVVQTTSADGLTSESDAIPLSIACRPQLEVYVEPPTGRILGGQAVEAMVLVKNAGPCVARKAGVAIEGLPGAIARPPAQEIIELAAGATRYVTFNLLLPQDFRGEASLYARVQESTGGEAQSERASFVVGGLPIVWSIVLGFLALLAIAAMVVGAVLYLRAR